MVEHELTSQRNRQAEVFVVNSTCFHLRLLATVVGKMGISSI